MPLAALFPPSVNGASVAPFVFICLRRLNELRSPITALDDPRDRLYLSRFRKRRKEFFVRSTSDGDSTEQRL